jgi:NAD(P)-dependent dehydrogenase (short-subunit alcohol dehydrogenase family)
MRLEGRVALITGADGPLGTATALRFAREGALVVLNDVVSSHLERVAREIADVEGGRAIIALGDVTRSAHVDRMVREAVEAFGGIDILVNQADDDEDVAVTGASLCAEAMVPLMRERRWGRVINVSTTAALVAAGLAPESAVGKSLVTLTRALAREHASAGVTVNCVAPGVIARATSEPGTMAILIPLGRLAEPRDVAAAQVFFASEDAAYVTGQVLFVDGGLTLAS